MDCGTAGECRSGGWQKAGKMKGSKRVRKYQARRQLSFFFSSLYTEGVPPFFKTTIEARAIVRDEEEIEASRTSKGNEGDVRGYSVEVRYLSDGRRDLHRERLRWTDVPREKRTRYTEQESLHKAARQGGGWARKKAMGNEGHERGRSDKEGWRREKTKETRRRMREKPG